MITATQAAEVRVVRSTRRARVYRCAPLAERFWKKIDKNGTTPAHRPDLGPCWIWTGSRDNHGYGQIRESGKRGRLLKAHRVAYAIAHGAVGDDVLVCHHCDNPSCVRDSHLFVGTSADNSQDAAAKGRLVFQAHPERHPRGERVGGVKLTREQVDEIRRLHSSGWTQTRLAARFGVTQANVSEIVRGRTWRD